MDPSVMKFLEEDEDETMHSGADVDAFTAALNRDIQGQFESLWQPTSNNENTDQNQQEQPEQHSSEVQVKLEPGSEYQQQEDIASHCQVPRPQHVQPPPKYKYQDVLQTPQAMDSQCHDKTPMDINELGGKVKLESVINQHAVTAGMHNHPGAIGTGNLQVPARGMNVQHSSSLVMKNQQAVTTGVGNHQLMAGSGVHSQQLPRQSVLQQSPASGMTNQQSVAIAMGISNQQSVAMRSSNQQPMFNSGLSIQQANSSNRAKQVPFARLLPILTHLLDKDRGMQLEDLYKKLKGNEITEETFVRHMRATVGDQMLKRGVYNLQQQDSKEDAAMQRISNLQIKAESNDSTLDNNTLQPYEVGHQGDSHNMQSTQLSSSYGSASSTPVSCSSEDPAEIGECKHKSRSSFLDNGLEGTSTLCKDCDAAKGKSKRSLQDQLENSRKLNKVLIDVLARKHSENNALKEKLSEAQVQIKEAESRGKLKYLASEEHKEDVRAHAERMNQSFIQELKAWLSSKDEKDLKRTKSVENTKSPKE